MTTSDLECTAFGYAGCDLPLRGDLIESYRQAWNHISAPGNWFDGAERVAIAQEVRSARDCEFCARRKAALSPYREQDGAHSSSSTLAGPVIDAVHRLTTDASRITRRLIDDLAAHDISEAAYVEIVGVVVTVIGIDTFNEVIGAPQEPLPAAQPGEASGYLPGGLVNDVAMVSIIGRPESAEADLYPNRVATANITRSLSLVPNEVRMFRVLSSAQYLSHEASSDFKKPAQRALTRPQIELVAARVSAINDCFY